jgi:hypothetical protein
VVDEAGRALPVGEIGEVVVRGDVVMAGYWQNPEATAESIREGWLYTGDMGSMDVRRMSDPARSLKGPHHQRWDERLPPRGGRGTAHPFSQWRRCQWSASLTQSGGSRSWPLS